MVFLFNMFFIRSFREEYRVKEEKNRSKKAKNGRGIKVHTRPSLL